jgi:V/A-type H+/Na+-transporting ATPase subunit C
VAGSPYASALGRFKAILPTLLPKDAYPPLVQARDLTDALKLLEPTVYGPELVQAGATARGAAVFEVAINRVLVRRLRLVQDAAPFAGKSLIRAYLRRWDIENISLILSAKSEGRTLAETESQLISSRETPAGLVAGPMTLDDLRQVLALPTLDAVVNQLVKFGYGGTLLPLLDGYQRTHDIFPLLSALQKEYYRNILESAKFFQGDEWVVREFVRSEIDGKNVLLLLKGKDANVPVEVVLERFIDGGSIARDRIADLYNVRSVAELVGQLEARFPALTEALPSYQAASGMRSLVPFEIALTRERVVRELKRLRSFPLSICILFSFLLLSEMERADLRRIVYGKLYGVSADEVSRSLIVPKI